MGDGSNAPVDAGRNQRKQGGSHHTREQKDRFAREVLPELERLMEDARRRFDQMKDPQRGEELEREFRRIQEALAV